LAPFHRDASEEIMTFEEILESVAYLSWALDFLLLGIVLSVATVSYRRLARRAGRGIAGPHAQGS
jgi:hypothetical protein